MHRSMSRKDAWVASAILVSTLTSLCPANAQENHLGETPSQTAETVRPKSPRPAQHSNATTPTSEEGTVPTETNIATVAESTNSELEIADTRRLTLVIGQSKTVTLPAFAN